MDQIQSQGQFQQRQQQITHKPNRCINHYKALLRALPYGSASGYLQGNTDQNPPPPPPQQSQGNIYQSFKATDPAATASGEPSRLPATTATILSTTAREHLPELKATDPAAPHQVSQVGFSRNSHNLFNNRKGTSTMSLKQRTQQQQPSTVS